MAIQNETRLSGVLNVGDGIAYASRRVRYVPLLAQTLNGGDMSESKNATVSLGNSAPTGSCFDGRYIWCPLQAGGGSLEVIDITTNSTIASFSGLGANARGATYDGAGSVWVAVYSNNTIIQYNADTLAFVTSVAVGTNPYNSSFDGKYIWVNNSTDGSLSKVDIKTATVVATVTGFSTPSGSCFDGTYLWVANNGASTINKVDVVANSIVGSFSTGGASGYMCCFDGTHIWSGLTDNTVIKLDSSGAIVATVPGFNGPTSLVFDGSYIWVANDAANTIVQVDILNNSILNTVTVGANPYDGCFDGTHLWFPNSGSNTISKVLTRRF
jgi:YVTN family beta-propeller protein